MDRQGCFITGIVIVRAVYAAHLFGVVPRGPDGQSIGDDLTVRLKGVRGRTYLRSPDSPAMLLAGPDEDLQPGWSLNDRDAVDRVVGSDARVHIPVLGPGWLDSLCPGAVVEGDLFVQRRGRDVSLAEELLSLNLVVKVDDDANDSH